ncbi:MAG: NUDIX domain-containing protein [Planctomycetes bacterium]|nr:NUDIX domain-containing protein [Planctomycetota bacterium]
MTDLPYRIACLCDLRDARGRVLLIRRAKSPNLGLCSPIGGKLDMASGESPARCAQREIREEAGIDVALDDLHLLGLVAERAYEQAGHWLMFIYRVTRPVVVEPIQISEGRLEWHDPGEIDALPLPETDRRIIWPLIRANETAGPAGGPGFFAVHIDCRGDAMSWRVEQSSAAYAPMGGDGPELTETRP